MKKKIPPIVVKPPKKRLPQAPPAIEHRDLKDERERMPSGRLEKHKRDLKTDPEGGAGA